MRRVLLRCMVWAAAAYLPASALAQDTFIWDQPVDGQYSNADNWFSVALNGTGILVPDVPDTILFDKEGAYTITMDANQEVRRVTSDTGFTDPIDVTLDMGGFTFHSNAGWNGTAVNDFSFTTGFNNGTAGATTTFLNGTATMWSNILPFGTATGPANIVVGAGGALYNENAFAGAEGFAWSRIGAFDGTHASLSVEDGGLYQVNALSVGINGRPIGLGADAVGTLNVDGAGSMIVGGGQSVFGAGTGFTTGLGELSGVAGDGGIESDAIGNLNATNGGVAQFFALSLGFMEDFSDAPTGRAIGNVTSTGAGSNVIADFNFTIGETEGGIGDVTASNGGQVTAAQPGFLGFIVGEAGEGTMTADSGGQLIDNEQSVIGRAASGVGVVSVSGAGSLYQANSAFVGDLGTATINVTAGGQVSFAEFSVLGNQAGGGGMVTVNGAGSKFDAGGVVVGADGTGSISVSSNGVATADELTDGFVDVTLRGTISLTGGGSMTAGPGAASAPVTTANTLTVISGGALAGSGTINGNLHNVGGEVFGITNLTVNGAFEQEAAGAYSVNVVSNGVNSSMDVTGVATLGGDLFIAVDGGYVPAGLDSFVVMTYDSAVDCFMSVTNRDLPGAGPGGIDLVFAHVQNATDYRLVVTVPGDYSLDGQVTGADYTIWADSFGDAHTAFNTGDGNADGMTTGADFTIWADNFGSSAQDGEAAATVPTKADWDRLEEMGLQRVPTHEMLAQKEAISRDMRFAVGGASGHAVPEPSTLALAGLAALGLLGAARRRS